MKYNKGFLKFKSTQEKIKKVANKAYHAYKRRSCAKASVALYSKEGGVVCYLQSQYSFGEKMDILLSDNKTKVGEVFALKGKIRFN